MAFTFPQHVLAWKCLIISLEMLILLVSAGSSGTRLLLTESEDYTDEQEY